MSVKFFYDLETTGLKPSKHSIHQISGYIEVDEEVVEEFNFKTRPHPKAAIEPEAMKKGKVTEEQIKAYPEMKTVFQKVIRMLSNYIDPYESKQRAFLVGFNNSRFDDEFFRRWFSQNGNEGFDSWFWSHAIDVLCLASEYLENRRPNMPSFKLKRVAIELGIEVHSDKLHDAAYDIHLTREIYRIVTGREIEM